MSPFVELLDTEKQRLALLEELHRNGGSATTAELAEAVGAKCARVSWLMGGDPKKRFRRLQPGDTIRGISARWGLADIHGRP